MSNPPELKMESLTDILDDRPLLEAIPVQEAKPEASANLQPPMEVMSLSEATPMALIQGAVARGADLSVIEKLMDLRDREEGRRAKLAFNAAFSAFKAEAVQIIKNVQVNDGPLKGKSYANLAAVVDSVTPALSKHGLSLSWRLTQDKPDWMEVEATLRHAEGHAETTSMGGPPDIGGAKNAIQARGSSKSYLERYTALAILGLAAKEQDTDGLVPDMAENAFQGHLKAMREAKTLTDLQEVFTKAIKATGKDLVTQKAMIKVKDERKAELMGLKS